MCRSIAYRIALGLLAVASARAGADPVAVNATVVLTTQAQVGDATLQTDRFGRSTGNLDPISHASSVYSETDNGIAAAFTSIDCSWDSPASGSVRFGETGFSTDVNVAGGTVNVRGTRWTYVFMVTDADVFTLTYEVDVTDDTTDATGLYGYRFVIVLGGYDPVCDEVLSPGSAGVLAINLEAGQQYAVSLFAEAGLDDGLGSRTAGMTGTFAWGIDPGS